MSIENFRDPEDLPPTTKAQKVVLLLMLVLLLLLALAANRHWFGSGSYAAARPGQLPALRLTVAA